jgi:hypothetical protein
LRGTLVVILTYSEGSSREREDLPSSVGSFGVPQDDVASLSRRTDQPVA